MVLAVLVVTIAQLLDLGTFVRMVAVHGLGSEANPIVAGLLSGQGLPVVIVAKVVGLALVVAVIAVLAGRDGVRSYPRLAAGVAIAAIAAGLVGGWSNAVAIIARPF